MADPLSIPTTILPESSFDPVQFAKERRQEVLTEQKDRRERYNKAWESVGNPSGMNRNIQQELIARRNKLFDEGASKSAQGIDLTDISHPKYGRDAMDFRGGLDQLNIDIEKTGAIDQLLSEARKMIAKDDKGVIDVNATNANIAKIQSAKSLDEIDQFLSSKGDSIIELKPKQFDMDQYIVDYMKDKGVKGMAVSEETPKGSFLITEQYNQIPPEELKNAFMGMLQDPTFKAKVKEMRANDATDLRGGSDLDYLMERKGNRLARQQTGLNKEWIKPDKATGTKNENKSVEQVSEPETLAMVNAVTGKTDSVTGENTFAFDQSKHMKIRVGKGAIDVNTGKKTFPSDYVDFTPISSSEYYVSTEKTKGKSLFETVEPGVILPGASKSAKKQRFVLGVYTSGTGVNETKKTVLIPYDNIKNTLDKVYGVEGGLPTTKETDNATEDQQAYEWAIKNPNDPRAKKILNLLNKK